MMKYNTITRYNDFGNSAFGNSGIPRNIEAQSGRQQSHVIKPSEKHRRNRNKKQTSFWFII